MIDLCEYAVSAGEKAGADEIEAVWSNEVTTLIEAELGEISRASMTVDRGMRIRVIKDKALGSGFTYQLSKPGVIDTVEKALAAARASRKDEHWDSLPQPGRYPSLDAWDPDMATISSEELAEPILEMLQLVPEGIAVHSATNEVVLQERACVNSSGIEHEWKGTVGAVVLEAVGNLEEGVTPEFYEISFLRKYNPNPPNLVESLVKKIDLFRTFNPASSGKSHVIFSPLALEGLLQYTLFKAVSGENVARGKSLLAGKEGEKVASSALTLHDNGTVPEGVFSQEMDDEGVPCQDTPLIEDGILEGFVWNDYWAKRTGTASTGNAVYDERTDELVIQQTAMVITPGDYTREELIDIKDGYYVLGLQGAHGANPESGDFSVVCAPAYRIRNGEIAGGVVGVMLSDNMFSLLKRIDAVGREPQVLEYTVFPHIRFSDVNVVSK